MPGQLDYLRCFVQRISEMQSPDSAIQAVIASLKEIRPILSTITESDFVNGKENTSAPIFGGRIQAINRALLQTSKLFCCLDQNLAEPDLITRYQQETLPEIFRLIGH
jgi:hypothetical protein